MQPKKKLTKAEAGRLGGLRTKQRHGTEHFRRIGQAGAKALLAKYGTEHFRKIGKAGFDALARRIGLWNTRDVYSGRSRAIDFLAGQGKLKPRWTQPTPEEQAALDEWVDRTIDELTKDLPPEPEEDPDPVIAQILRSIRSAPIPADGGL
jgi:hypothetical protein